MRVKSVFYATLAAAGLFLTGCSVEPDADAQADAAQQDGSPDAGRAASAADAGPVSAPDDTAAPEPAEEVDPEDVEPVRYEVLDENGGEFRFTYAWPAKVSAIPALVSRLKEERAALEREWSADWAAAKQTAPADCAACARYTYAKEWQVVTDTPRYLSLSARIATYTGGAHGMVVFDSAAFDRRTGALLEPVNMFRSAEALSGVVREAFCAQIDRQRAKKRGGRDIGGAFSECIDPVENSTVILGSAGGQKFDRIGFLVPPYNAGPYAEGTYEVTLAVTPAILDAVRPEYRRSFQVP